jgi:hypothetical protein
VSVDLSAHFAGWDAVCRALNDLRASHGDFEKFFTGMFDQLETMAAELKGREQQLAQTADGNRRQAVVADADRDSQVRQMLEESQQQRAELRGTQEAIHGQVARLAAVAAELSQAQVSHQQSCAEQERADVEAELDAVRGRAAELAESLAEQKRLFGRQQAEWSEELKRMRGLLEAMSGRLDEAIPALPAGVPEPRSGPAAGDPAAADPVLDSVMAQFQILQRGMARRKNS